MNSLSGEKLLNEFKLVPQISNESIADAIAYPASVSFSSWIWNRSVLFGSSWGFPKSISYFMLCDHPLSLSVVLQDTTMKQY